MDLDVFVLEIGTNWNSNIEAVKKYAFRSRYSRIDEVKLVEDRWST